LSARIDDAPRLYEQSMRERLFSSIRQRVQDPSQLLGSIGALGAGTLGGVLGGRFLGARMGGHGLLGGVLGGVLLGGAALGASLLPNLLGDRRDADGSLPRPRLDDATIRELVAAETDRDRDAADLGAGPDQLRNAHVSNTVEQLRMAMAGDYNSLEGDVRLEHGVPVMSHDPGGAGAVLFADWLRVGVATGKHLRIDFKEAAAIDQVSAMLHELDVPDEQVTLNLSTGDPISDSDVERGTLERLRAAHPNALIGFNLPKLRLGDPDAPLLAAARAIGGPTQISIAIGDAYPERITELLDAGVHVGVWNDPKTDPVRDPRATTERLRRMGVDGLVDLRRADDPMQK
jgi:hypothetical protein